MKVGLLGMLGILFIALKLCGVIAWSWWLVLLPLYIGLLVLAIALFAGGTLLGLMAWSK